MVYEKVKVDTGDPTAEPATATRESIAAMGEIKVIDIDTKEVIVCIETERTKYIDIY